MSNYKTAIIFYALALTVQVSTNSHKNYEQIQREHDIMQQDVTNLMKNILVQADERFNDDKYVI